MSAETSTAESESGRGETLVEPLEVEGLFARGDTPTPPSERISGGPEESTPSDSAFIAPRDGPLRSPSTAETESVPSSPAHSQAGSASGSFQEGEDSSDDDEDDLDCTDIRLVGGPSNRYICVGSLSLASLGEAPLLTAVFPGVGPVVLTIQYSEVGTGSYKTVYKAMDAIEATSVAWMELRV